MSSTPTALPPRPIWRSRLSLRSWLPGKSLQVSYIHTAANPLFPVTDVPCDAVAIPTAPRDAHRTKARGDRSEPAPRGSATWGFSSPAHPCLVSYVHEYFASPCRQAALGATRGVPAWWWAHRPSGLCKALIHVRKLAGTL